MLRFVTWGQFAMGLLFLFVLYYGTILTIFKRHLLFNSKTFFEPGAPRKSEITSKNTAVLPAISPFEQASRLAAVIEAKIVEAGSKRYVRDELLRSLKEIIKQYNDLAGTAFQTAINVLVIQNSQTVCSISLSEMDVKALWVG